MNTVIRGRSSSVPGAHSSIVIALVAAALSFGSAACGAIRAESPGLVPASQVDEPRATEGVVVLVRPSAVGEGYAFPIRDEAGNLIAQIGAESQFAVHVAPGERTLVLECHGTREVVHLDVTQGSTQFVMIELGGGTVGPRWTMRALDTRAAAAPEFQMTLARTPKYRLESQSSSGIQVASRGEQGR